MTDNKYSQWYIATTIIGSEESIFNSLMDKITAYDFNDHVFGMKIINYKEVKIEFFDEQNPPPKSMKNSKYIQWFALEDGRYKKVTTKVLNKFPGYIFINMIMTDEIWFIIRNTPGITGFVGSSGKGAKPIPISSDELENLFFKENEEVITYENARPQDKEGCGVACAPISKSSSNKVEELKIDEDGFFDSKIVITPSNEETNLVNEQLTSHKNNQVDDFRVGHTVKILEGSFAGTKALIKNIIPEENSVEVEIDILGRSTLIKLNVNAVTKDED